MELFSYSPWTWLIPALPCCHLPANIDKMILKSLIYLYLAPPPLLDARNPTDQQTLKSSGARYAPLNAAGGFRFLIYIFCLLKEDPVESRAWTYDSKSEYSPRMPLIPRTFRNTWNSNDFYPKHSRLDYDQWRDDCWKLSVFHLISDFCKQLLKPFHSFIVLF